MEKSVGIGLEPFIRKIPGMKQIDPKQCSPLVLAYVGDCVFDLIVKTMVVGRGNRPVHRLHEETSRYVQASAQSYMMRFMQEHLNEEEHAVYRRGRNARSVSPAKNQSITDYRRATGFEALIGHLYLSEEYERLTELVTIGLEAMEEKTAAASKAYGGQAGVPDAACAQPYGPQAETAPGPVLEKESTTDTPA